MVNMADLPDSVIDEIVNNALEELACARIGSMPTDLDRITDQLRATGHSIDPALDEPYSLNHGLNGTERVKILRYWTVTDFEELLDVVSRPDWRAPGGADVVSLGAWRAYVLALATAIYSMRNRGGATFVPEVAP